MIDSRNKGKRGELQAAAVMSAITRRVWYRTAQRSGTETGDIRCDEIPLHVEVKNYASGFTWWIRRASRSKVCMGGDLYYCEITNLMGAILQDGNHEAGVRSPLVESFMAQAVRDCGDQIPMVLCRQNNSPWLVVWRHQDDDRFCSLLRSIRDCAGGSCAS